MMRVESLVLLLMTVLNVVFGNDHGDGCYFHDKEAFCESPAARNLSIQVTINDCVLPVDVNFHLMHGENWTWSHSFVNHDETQSVASAPMGEYLSLHVVVTHQRPTLLYVQANLVIDGIPEAMFLNDSTPIQEQHQCKPADTNQLLPLVIFVVLLSMSAILLLWVLVWRRKALCMRRVRQGQQLLLDMDRPATSYSHDDDTSQHSTKSSSTVVRNSIYADHLSSKTSLPAIPEYFEDTGHRDTKYKTVSTEPPQREDMREDIPMEEFTIHGDETDVIIT